MRWPWSKEKDRGTLTFLPDGNVIIGFPLRYQLTPEAAHRMQLAWEWAAATTKPMIFPFAIDVVDMREREDV